MYLNLSHPHGLVVLRCLIYSGAVMKACSASRGRRLSQAETNFLQALREFGLRRVDLESFRQRWRNKLMASSKNSESDTSIARPEASRSETHE